MNKTYRFFYHYNKANKKMTVHFRKNCTIVDDIICMVPCETHWQKIQPQLVMRGKAQEVSIKNNKAYIS